MPLWRTIMNSFLEINEVSGEMSSNLHKISSGTKQSTI